MSWGAAVMPKHLLEGKDITKSPLTRRPVGTGPYIFREWVTGQKIVLVSNLNTFEGRSLYRRLRPSNHPRYGHHVLGAPCQGHRHDDLTPLQYTRQTENPSFRKKLQQVTGISPSPTPILGYNMRNPLFCGQEDTTSHFLRHQQGGYHQGILLGYGRPRRDPINPGPGHIIPMSKSTLRSAKGPCASG